MGYGLDEGDEEAMEGVFKGSAAPGSGNKRVVGHFFLPDVNARA